MKQGAWTEEKPLDGVTVDEIDKLAHQIFKLRTEKDNLEAETKEVNKRLFVVTEKFTAYLSEFKKSRWEVEGLGTIQVKRHPSVRMPVTPQDKDVFYKYLKEKGIFESMVSVNSRSLNAFYSRELEAQQEAGNFDFEMPGIARHTVRETISVRKK